MVAKTLLIDLYNNDIRHTKYKEYVRLVDIYVGSISIRIAKLLKTKSLKVYVSTKCLKHIHDRYVFDKGQPDIIENLIEFLPKIITDPDCIKKNKDSKKALVVFIKEVNKKRYACPLEILLIRKRGKTIEMLYIGTAFVVKSHGQYLEKNEVLYKK